MPQGAIIVLDVGKTMRKLSLWTSDGELIAREARANVRRKKSGTGVLDVDGIAPWLTQTLSTFATKAQVAHIIPVAHGAGLVAVRDGALAFAPADYETAVPVEIRTAYLPERDSFSLTGSPALAEGLNAGIQLFQAERDDPGILDGATLMPWAQYWAWFLSGEARSEVTSLGCHTDLWSPRAGDFSPMAKRFGWADKFAPQARAADTIGTLRPSLVRETGLPANTQIHCGLHDSNAALVAARAFPQIGGQEATVLSTGTWFVAMRTPRDGFDMQALPDGRDCLVNVDVEGRPVPSARFMGGREIETLIGIDTRRVDIKPDQPPLLAAVPGILESGAMLQPTLAIGFGPFPNGRGRWIDMPQDWFARRAAACVYTAMVADVSLDLIGAKETILVEGRFAEAEVIVRALAALRPTDRIFTSHAHNDVSFGALRLINSDLQPEGQLKPVRPLDVDLTAYQREWLRLAEATGLPA